MSLTETSVYVPSPTTVRAQSSKLSASADGTRIAYGAGKSAVIRSLVDGPNYLFGHQANCTVAKISPSGYYVASGDSSGNFKVWDSTNPTTIKLESKPISKINDIAWDAESKRLVVVGEGREKFGATFSLDTGASIGEIGGHSKVVNAVALRGIRPFRAVTGSDDSTVCLSNGLPFKFSSQIKDHTRFVQSVDYSPSGSLFLSSGSDSNIFIYDGLTGASKSSIISAHKGTIFQASFSKDGTQIGSSSADGTVKLWDVESGKGIQTWDFSTTESTSILSQQVGSTFLTPSTLLTLSFSGLLQILDLRSPTPLKQLIGHQNPITSISLSPSGEITSGDSSGLIRKWNSGGVAREVGGGGHANLVVGIVESGGKEWSAGWDDQVKGLEGETFSSSSYATGSIPKGLSASPSTSSLFLATAGSLQKFSTKTSLKELSIPLDYSPTSVAASKDGKLVAVGAEKNATFVYGQDGLVLKGKLEGRNAVTQVAFSNDGTRLAVGSSDGKILLYDATTLTLIHSRFSFHSARISSLAFNSTSTLLASGSLDESIRIYNLENIGKVVVAKNVHRGGVSSVAWKGDDEIVSAGADGALRVFKWKV